MPPIKSLATINVLVASLSIPLVASAHEGDDPRVVLHVGEDYESCYFDLHPELTEAEFREFSAEAGQVVRARQLSSADTLGAGAVDVSLAYAYFFLDDTKGSWNNTMSHPTADHYLGQQLGMPQLSVRVGVSRNVDVEAYGSVNWMSNYGLVGVASKIRLLDQADGRPVSVAVRPSAAALVGPSEVQVANVSADLSVSRTFHGFTPFAGVTLSATAVRETSDDTEVEPQFASRPLAFGGVEYRWKHITAAAQAEFSDLTALGLRVGGRF